MCGIRVFIGIEGYKRGYFVKIGDVAYIYRQNYVHSFRNVQCFEWTLHPSLGTTKISNVGNEWHGYLFKAMDRRVTLE